MCKFMAYHAHTYQSCIAGYSVIPGMRWKSGRGTFVPRFLMVCWREQCLRESTPQRCLGAWYAKQRCYSWCNIHLPGIYRRASTAYTCTSKEQWNVNLIQAAMTARLLIVAWLSHILPLFEVLPAPRTPAARPPRRRSSQPKRGLRPLNPSRHGPHRHPYPLVPVR